MRTKPETTILGASIAIAVAAACGGSSEDTAGSMFGNADGGGLHDGASGGGLNLDGGSGASSGASSGGSSGASGGGAVDASFACDGCAPFPGQGATSCAPQTLGAPTLVYPPDGVLLPPNMNVLEVQWVPPATGTASLYEVDFSNGVTDVRVETPCNAITSVRGVANVGCGLTLSQTEWNDLATTNANGDPVAVTVRATPANAQCVTASPQSVKINFAKENLSGGIYYWQSATYGGVAGTTGGIYFHDFGTFDPTPTPFWTSGSTGTCIGCHTLSKDGVRMSLMDDDPDADDEFSDVHTLTLDVASRTVLGGQQVSPGFQTFTHDHQYMIASTFKGVMGGMGGPMGGGPGAAVDTSFAVWSGDGTTLVNSNTLPTGTQGTQPNLSQDDKTLVFVAPGLVNGASSISQAGDHHFMGGSLWSAAFSEATSTLSGYAPFLTATGSQNFYYPDQSVDGNWVVFNENDDTSAANNDGDCFYSRQARVKILHFPPQSGDAPLDLPSLNVANGLTNSWPRFSPVVQTYKNHQILWVTFSSNRDYGLHLKNSGFDNYYPPESPTYDQPQPASKQGVTFDNYAAPQIWMAATLVDPDRSLDATDRSFPAFWLPFQDVTAHNHSAQWVATVQTGAGPGTDGGATGDGGTGPGTDAGGTGTDGAAPVCGENGATCGTGSALCCSDVVCCGGSCVYSCLQ
jgi:hypothetical protein